MPPLLLLLQLVFFLLAGTVSSDGKRKCRLHRFREHDYGSKRTPRKRPTLPKSSKEGSAKSSKAEGRPATTTTQQIKSPTEARPTETPQPPPPPSTQPTQPPTNIIIPEGARLISLRHNARKITLPDDIQSPIKLDLQDNSNSSHYEIILSPTIKDGQLVTLTRVDRNVTTINERRRLTGQKDAKPTHIPISRSYDGRDWQKVQGKYIAETNTVCGYAESMGCTTLQVNTFVKFQCQN